MCIDVATAFSVMLRGLKVPLSETEANAALTLKALGFRGEDCSGTMNETHRAREWTAAEPHVQHLTATFHESIWTRIYYKAGVVASAIGTIAGMPFADAIFIIAAPKGRDENLYRIADGWIERRT